MKRQPSEEIAFAYRWAILGILWTAYVVVFVQRLSIGPLGPFLKEDMGITSAQVGSLMSAASFGQMFSMAPGGWLADRVGVRWLLVVGEMAAGIAMLGMFFGPSYGAALAIMTAAGLGCGCLTPGTTKGVMVWFPTRERATAMGFKQTGVNVAGIVTAMVLPTVALALGWRFGFLFLRVVAIAIALCSFTLYREPTAAVDPRSVNRATHADIAKPATGRPLLELLRSRDIWLVAIAGLALVTVEFAVIAHLVLYLTEALLFPVVAAGMILAATEAGGALGKPGGGFLSDRFFGGSRRKVYILWGGIALAACALITLWGGGQPILGVASHPFRPRGYLYWLGWCPSYAGRGAGGQRSGGHGHRCRRGTYHSGHRTWPNPVRLHRGCLGLLPTGMAIPDDLLGNLCRDTVLRAGREAED